MTSARDVLAARRKPPTVPPRNAYEGVAVDSRIRALEDAVDAAQTANVAMKRLYGRALIKRRAAERERDALRAALAAKENDGEPPSAPPTPLKYRSDDDDRRSTTSFASSALFGDDREAQLESLSDLVALLEAKVALGNTPTRTAELLSRAKNTLNANRSVSDENIVAERDELRRKLDAVTAAKDSAPPTAAQYAALRVALDDARADATAWRSRAAALERLRNVSTAPDPKLQAELADAKRTIGRLVSERSSLRRQSNVVPVLPKPPMRQPERDPRLAPSPDVVRRVHEWRERASSETAVSVAAARGSDEDRRERRQKAVAGGPYTVPVSNLRSSARKREKSTSGARNGVDIRRVLGTNKTNKERLADRAERVTRVTARTERGMEHLLPDRLRSDLSERARARDTAASERSEKAPSEAESSASMQIGIVGRHTSFTSTNGGQNRTSVASSTTAPDFFGTTATRSDGLRGLVADSLLG